MARCADGRLLLGLALSMTLLGPTPGRAEVATDGTLGAKVQLTGKDVRIPARLGQVRGQNLFHSFERFGVDTGGKVTFTGPDGLKNVIGRVTGGERSTIDGTLASRIPGADMWLLNPAGILFGPNARLDVKGSFHASTADELRFADGAVFSALDTNGSVLSVAPPEAFGFLGTRSPAGITVDQSVLEVPEGKALSLVGGDITVWGDGVANDDGFADEPGTLRAEVGRVSLAALAGPGAVLAGTNEAQGAVTGEIHLSSGAAVASSGNGGGTIRIRGGQLVVEGSSHVFAGNFGSSDATSGVVIEAGKVSVVGASLITADSIGRGNAGRVEVAADTLEVRDGKIGSTTFGPGRGGPVLVAADRLTIADEGAVATSSEGSGAAGDVSVQASRLEVRDGSEIGSFSTYIGAAGDVRLLASTLIVDDAVIGTEGRGAEGGRIGISAQDLIYFKDARLTTSGILPGVGTSNISIIAPMIAVNNSTLFSFTGAGLPLEGSGLVWLFGDATVISVGSFVETTGFEGQIGSQLVVPESVFLNVGNLLRESCGARRSGAASSFTAMGRGGLPPDPGGPLAGAYREPDGDTAADRAGPVLAASFGDGCGASPES